MYCGHAGSSVNNIIYICEEGGYLYILAGRLDMDLWCNGYVYMCDIVEARVQV